MPGKPHRCCAHAGRHAGDAFQAEGEEVAAEICDCGIACCLQLTFCNTGQ
jgi:hypothetical protein